MMRISVPLPYVIGLVLLAGCGQSSHAPTSTSPGAGVKPDVIVTVDNEHHTCLISKHSEPTGSTVGCADVVPFIRDELRVRDGSSYDIRGLAPVDEIETNKVRSALDGAGFRFVGGPASRSR
jgi:hypothetical protein